MSSSYSSVWKEYEKIMTANTLLKTAADKEKDYNTVAPSAGEGSLTEETGYELIEIAHPNQIQVATSQLGDGIVENGVEQQKAMIDVALRNPRGVLAELMAVLVKAANVLEDDMKPENIKVIAEIDGLLEKIAQESFYSADTQFAELLQTASTAVKSFEEIAWSSMLFRAGSEVAEKKIEAITSTLKRFVGVAKNVVKPEQKKQWSQQLSAIVNANSQEISEALKEAHQSGFFLTAPVKQFRAWSDLVAQAGGVPNNSGATTMSISGPAPSGLEPINKTLLDRDQMPSDQTDTLRTPRTTIVPKVQPEAKTQHAPAAIHQYKAYGPEVKELQTLVGADVDGKFGPKTFDAVMEAARKYPDLKAMIWGGPNDVATELARDWKEWDLSSVQQALAAIKRDQEQPLDLSQMPPMI